jgi:carboxyl-terminal processing protease
MSSLFFAIGRGRAALLLGLAVLAGCARAAPPPPPADAGARLFAQALQDIDRVYIAPVSERKLILSGLANLARFDRDLSVAETPAPENRIALALSYHDRQLALLSPPADDDGIGWGELASRAIATAKAASPRIAARSADRIEQAVFDGMTGALDGFSRYSAPRAARAQRAALEGFSGIGITLDAVADGFSVGAVLPQGPAARAGIAPGDRIVAIDGRRTAGHSRAEIVGWLRGPLASIVALTISHPSGARERRFLIRRALVVPPTVTESERGGIVIFRITGFSRDTAQKLAAGLQRAERMSGRGLQGIVLDLRGDPGGLLKQAVAVSDLFIAGGAIAATIGRNPASRQFFAASGVAIAPATPVVALIDGGSASASEIVAAALQDAHRAVIVGSASYGKGTVQTVLPMANGGELTLTWALLVRPSGYLLNRHGVIPDVCTSGLAEDANARSIALAARRAPARLGEADWLRLRRACPARTSGRNIDLAVAERLLADPALYRAALGGWRPAPVLTEPASPLISASPAP